MRYIRAELSTSFGDFPVEIESTAENGIMKGKYSILGYEGKYDGVIDENGVYSFSGTLDTYVGPVFFELRGVYEDGKPIIAHGTCSVSKEITLRETRIDV